MIPMVDTPTQADVTRARQRYNAASARAQTAGASLPHPLASEAVQAEQKWADLAARVADE